MKRSSRRLGDLRGPVSRAGSKQQVSTDGGAEPLWSRDGRELFFQQGARLMRAGVTLGAAFSSGTPQLVHQGRFLRSQNNQTSWSVTPDGSRFLRIQRHPATPLPPEC